MVREHDGAVDAAQLASKIGLHVTTVRFHLDALCDEGMIVRTRLSRPGAGRPRTGYKSVEERVDYRSLAEMLAMELGKTQETRARHAQRAGVKWAARLTASQIAQSDCAETTSEAETEDVLDREALRIIEVFRRMGFAPELATTAEPAARSSTGRSRERTIRLHACPVRDLARSHPEVACAIHEGLLRGLLKKPGDGEGRGNAKRAAVSAHLEPLVEPELCLARLVDK